MINIKIKKTKNNAKIPTRGSAFAAGYDLYASFCKEQVKDGRVDIWPDETALIPTGIKMEIPKGYFGAIFARSGLAVKQGLRPANCVAVIDCDYRGEILVALHNDSLSVRRVCDGDRVAQIVILPYQDLIFTETDGLSDTERSDGGFGSTGVGDKADEKDSDHKLPGQLVMEGFTGPQKDYAPEFD